MERAAPSTRAELAYTERWTVAQAAHYYWRLAGRLGWRLNRLLRVAPPLDWRDQPVEVPDDPSGIGLAWAMALLAIQEGVPPQEVLRAWADALDPPA